MQKIVIRSEYKTADRTSVVVALVGEITTEGDLWVFKYSEDWLASKKSIPFGLLMPLRKEPYTSKTMFSSFTNLLPEKDGQTYLDYAARWGIDASTEDWFEILPTVAHKGPSTFVLYPVGYRPGKWSEVDGDIFEWVAANQVEIKQ